MLYCEFSGTFRTREALLHFAWSAFRVVTQYETILYLKKNKDWSMLCADSDLSNIEMEIEAIDVSHSQLYFGR